MEQMMPEQVGSVVWQLAAVEVKNTFGALGTIEEEDEEIQTEMTFEKMAKVKTTVSQKKNKLKTNEIEFNEVKVVKKKNAQRVEKENEFQEMIENVKKKRPFKGEENEILCVICDPKTLTNMRSAMSTRRRTTKGR